MMKQTIILIVKVFFSFFFLVVSLPYFVFLIPFYSLLNPEEHGGHISLPQLSTTFLLDSNDNGVFLALACMSSTSQSHLRAESIKYEF